MNDQFDPDDDDLTRGQLIDHIRRLQADLANLETVFAETAQELGCKQDNEAILEAIAALRLRAVPAIVWPDDPRGPAKFGVFELFTSRICNAEQDWSWDIHPGDDAAEMTSGYADTLEDARRDCEAAFLRLVGCKNG